MEGSKLQEARGGKGNEEGPDEHWEAVGLLKINQCKKKEAHNLLVVGLVKDSALWLGFIDLQM